MTLVLIVIGMLLYLIVGCLFAFIMYTQTTVEMSNAELITCVLLWPLSLVLLLIALTTGKR